MSEPGRTEESVPAQARDESGEGPLSPEAAARLVHDLRVHQIELELQNEELRRTQQLLEASRARYFDLYDLAPVGYITLSDLGLIQEANFAAADLLRAPRGSLENQPLTRFLARVDQDLYYRHKKRLFETGERQVCELRLARDSGETCWVRFEATLVKGTEGAGYRAVVSDITARKVAEETVLASEARHRTLFEKSQDALMTLSPSDWRFTSGNPAAFAMFGVPDQEAFLALPLSTVFPERQPDGSQSVERARTLMDIAMREGSHRYDWTYRRRSGEEFPTSVLLTRLEVDGQPLLQATVRDETEMNRLRAMLGQADRLAAMGMLAAGVAHEINNPLAYVIYNVQTLAERLPKLACAVQRCVPVLRAELGEEAFQALAGDERELLEPSALQELADDARGALGGLQRIQGISKAIGAFSRVESSERVRVDVNYALQCALTMAQNDIKFRARLIVNCGELPPVRASEGKLSQVFLNLLINAAHAIDEGHVEENRIEVRSWALGADVFVELRDTGRGIEEANMRRIFEPFFTTKPVGASSGLGLAICRHIVAEAGGDISVESVVGRGTCVVVRLPAWTGDSAPAADTAAERPLPSGPRGRVLVVDDEAALRAMVVRMLRAEHELVTAESGAAARAILEQDQAFDLILLDLMMPDMTGMDLHQWLANEHPKLAERVVFSSGGAFTPKAADYVKRVGNLQLHKPYAAAKLRRVVAEAIAATRPR